MLVLVGCEESQTVTKAFIARGHTAYSCDLAPTRGNPDWHLQGDVWDAIAAKPWELIILHPPCTAMCFSGNGTYGPGKPRHADRVLALEWTLQLWEHAKTHANYVALENPNSALFTYIREVQFIHPYWFGHPEDKRTGLALHNLPRLKPTNIVESFGSRIHGMPPSPTRSRDRAVTYPGVAAAMAQQWGDLDGFGESTAA